MLDLMGESSRWRYGHGFRKPELLSFCGCADLSPGHATMFALSMILVVNTDFEGYLKIRSEREGGVLYLFRTTHVRKTIQAVEH